MDFGPEKRGFFLWIFLWIFSGFPSKTAQKHPRKNLPKIHRENQTPKSTTNFREGVSLSLIALPCWYLCHLKGVEVQYVLAISGLDGVNSWFVNDFARHGQKS